MRDLETTELAYVSGAGGLTPTQLDASLGSVWRGINSSYPGASLSARVAAFIMTAECAAVIAAGTAGYAIGTWIYTNNKDTIQDGIDYGVNTAQNMGTFFSKTWNDLKRTLPTD